MNNSSLNFAAVAQAWLRHPPRIGRLVETPAPGDPLLNPVVRSFIDKISLSAPSRSIDEVEHIVVDFLYRFADLRSWWGALLSENRIDVVFDSGEPRIKADDIGPWRTLSAALDPDSLVTHVFAHRYGRACLPHDLAHWGLVVGTQNPDIRRLFLDERVHVHDTHVHLEGCEPVPLLWEAVVAGRLRPGNFEQYRQFERLRSDGRSDLTHLVAGEMRAISKAIDAHDRLQRDLVGVAPSGSHLIEAGVNARLLWPERRMLSAAWAKLYSEPDRRSVSAFGRTTALDLDVYTQGKVAFLTRLIQGPGQNPGLANFRRYFRRGKVLPKGATKGVRNPRPEIQPSRRLLWERWCRMGRYATENAGLAGVEFRIAPFRRVADYQRFFTELEEKEKQGLFVNHKTVVSSFVIHFIRQEPSGPQLRVQSARERAFGHGLKLDVAAVDDDEARRSVDRASAILHRFRVTCPSTASRIVGIDVANVERRNPVHLFSPYIRLLRLRSKDGLPSGRPEHFRRWAEIISENLHIMPTGIPPLGLTFHAGEDFFHPLEGVKAIWEYMMFCDVRSGDRIGHGLALGVDVADFNETRGRSAVIPRGAALDLLAWLRHRLAVLAEVSAIGMRRIEDDISELSHAIYGSSHDAGELYALLRARHGLAKDTSISMHDSVRGLLERDRDKRTIDRARVYVALPESLLHPGLQSSFTYIQDGVVQEVINRDLFVETNPTSNVNILGLSSVKDHPIFRALKRHPGLRITVNTDDPGTFATSLEIEYALAREALRHNGFERVDLRLEELCRASEKSAFSTPPHRRPFPGESSTGYRY